MTKKVAEIVSSTRGTHWAIKHVNVYLDFRTWLNFLLIVDQLHYGVFHRNEKEKSRLQWMEMLLQIWPL